MARVVRFHQHGGPEVLRIEHVDVPRPGQGEVQIRVKALGLNRAEALLRAGSYIEKPTFPSGLGLEAAGVVEAVGAGVTAFAPGDAVSIVPPQSMVRWPAYGELIDIAKLGPGDFVAVTAASSSVGLAAIQIANRVGATPIAITRTSAKAPALLAAGAAHVVATAEVDLAARLQEITGPAGVRVVLDSIGGPIFEALTVAMSRGGILIEYGGLSPEPTPFPLLAVLSKTLTLRGYLVHEITGNPAKLEAAKAFILDGLASGAFRPTIARTFAFDEIVEAHRFLESNAQFGKIVVTV
ncbi:zinc-dependent alcohol dehydrogenase family protein [Ralstonia sp. 24A2]|uniref:zinc-dependent alcohol dehydrogenase family protein n=1 Tax=Ralstonia sp. 24A2 TaxID=3447364 RepID=UPI003F6A4FFB